MEFLTQNIRSNWTHSVRVGFTILAVSALSACGSLSGLSSDQGSPIKETTAFNKYYSESANSEERGKGRPSVAATEAVARADAQSSLTEARPVAGTAQPKNETSYFKTAVSPSQAQPQQLASASLTEELNAQRAELAAQQRRIDELERKIELAAQSQTAQATSEIPIYELPAHADQSTSTAKIQNASFVSPNRSEDRIGNAYQRAADETASGGREVVGEQRPAEKDQEEQIKAIEASGVRGVLTGKNQIVVEPSISASHSDINRFVFNGVQILDAFLIGTVTATEAERDFVSARLGARYGVTNKLEINAAVPGVYRNDSTTQTIATQVVGGGGSRSTDLDRVGLGDVEFGMQYQVNNGNNDWPIIVANVRGRAPTGDGPFEISRDAAGVETELPTGSGFWGVQPGITLVKPTDPVVYFANISYLLNVKRNVNTTIGGVPIREVDPGDAIGVNVGAALGITDKISASFGYNHFYINETTQEQVDGLGNIQTFKSEDLHVGTINFGLNQQLSRGAVNVQLSVGVTDDAPDVAVTIRRPIGFQL